MSTHLIRSIHKPRVVWIGVALVGAVLIAVFLRERAGTESPASAPDARLEASQEPRTEASAGIASTGDEMAPTASVACTAQKLDVTQDGKTSAVCVGDLSTHQNGSVRVYRVDSTSAPSRWLRIEVAGRNVLSAALGSGEAAEFQCSNEGCGGINLGKRDVDGARVISLDRVALTRASANASAPADRALVSGRLKTVPEHLLSGLACTGEGVSIVTSEGSSLAFCAKGGAGFELGDDGNRTYRFMSLEAESILVVVDPSRQVKQVEYQGDATLTCASAACGVRLSDPNASGERTFTFAGTTLTEKSRGEMNAVLNGTLIVPALE